MLLPRTCARRVQSLPVLAFAPLVGGRQPLTIERILRDPPIDGTLPEEVHRRSDAERFSLLEVRRGNGRRSPLLLEEAASEVGERPLDGRELPTFSEGKDAIKQRRREHQNLLTAPGVAGRLEPMAPRHTAGQSVNPRRPPFQVGGGVPRWAGTPE
jgi:hypothetical protein